MDASALRVAAAYFQEKAAASSDSINRFIETEWLPKIGAAIVREVGGAYKIDFKRGFVLVVTTGRPDTVEVIGLRVSTSYKSGLATMSLHHVIGSEASEVDSMVYMQFAKMKPEKVAEWAVESTQSRAQLQMFD